MGNIIIANMQANLTLDTHVFDANMTTAEQRLTALEQRTANLPATAGGGVGKATGDPEVAKRQEAQIARAQDVAIQSAQISQISALHTTQASTAEASHRRTKASFDDLVQAQIKGLASIGAQADIQADKIQRLSGQVAATAGSSLNRIPAAQDIQGHPALAGHATLTTDQAAIDMAKLLMGVTKANTLASGGTGTGTGGIGGTGGAWWTQPALTEADEVKRRAAADAAIGASVASRPAVASPDDAIYVNPSRRPPPQRQAVSTAVADQQAQGGMSHDLEMQIRQLASNTNPGNMQEMLDKIKPLVMASGQTDEQYKAALLFQSAYEDYQKQGTPEAAEKQAQATLQAQIRDLQGVPNDPTARLEQRLASLQAKMGAGGSGGGVIASATTQTPFGSAKTIEELLGLPAASEAGEGRTRGGRVAQGGHNAGMTAMEATEEERSHTFFPWFHPAQRGRAESLSYQRYQALESPGLGLAERALSPIAPGIGNALIAVAGPELAAAAAAVALGEGLKAATDAVMAYKEVTFQLTEQTKGTALGAGGAAQGFIASQSQQMLGMGVGGTQEAGLLAQISRYTQDPTLIAKTQQQSVDFARTFGTTIQQAQDLLIQVQQGNTGGLHQYIPSVWANDDATYAMAQVTARTQGAGARYMETPMGKQAQLSAEWEDMLTKAGEALLPVITGITDAGLKLMPVFTTLAQVIGTLASGIGWIVEHVLNPLGIASTPPNTATRFRVEGGVTKAVPNTSTGAGAWGTAPYVPVEPTTGSTGLDWAPGWGPTTQPPGKTVTLPQPLGATVGQGTPTGTGAGAFGTNGIIDTAQSHISSMRNIQEEVADTQSAVTGVQTVFAQLTTFHVDFSQVKGNLDNLEQGIEYLQHFWVDAAQRNKADIQGNIDNVTKTWLDMVNSMLGVMTGATSMLHDVYANSGEIPSEAELQTILDRTNVLFDKTNAIAKATMAGAGAGQQGVDLAVLQGWSTGMNAMVTFVGSATDTLGKIFSTPLPDEGRIQDAADKAVGVVVGMSSAFQKAFVKQQQGPVRPGQVMGSIIDSALSNGAAMATNGNAIMQFASAGVDVFKKMTNIAIPSTGEIDRAVDRIMTMTDRLTEGMTARLQARKELASQPSSTTTTSMGLVIPGMPDTSQTDTLFKQAGDAAANEQKILGMMQSGVSILANMRNLSIPSAGEISAAITAVFSIADEAIAMLPPQSPELQARMQAYGTAMQAELGAVSTGVDILAKMRDLAEPSASMMASFKTHMNVLEADFTESMPVDLAERVQAAGNALNAIYGSVSTGADVLGKIFSTPMPTTGDINKVRTMLTQVNQAFLPAANAMPQQMADNLKDWAAGMGPTYAALSAGVDMLGKVTTLFVPTHDELDKAFDAVKYLGDKATVVAQHTGPDLAKSITEYGNAMGAAFAGLNAGADFEAKLAHTPDVSKDMIDNYFKSLDDVMHDYDTGMDKWIKDAQLENAKYAGPMQSELTALTSGVEFLDKLGALRPDYSNAIRGYFAQLRQVTDEFGQELPRWQAEMTPMTDKISGYVKDEGDALNSVLDPLINIGQGSNVRPDQISQAFNNTRLALTQFMALQNAPGMQGEQLTKATRFASQMQEIFGAMKTTVEAVNVMNQPGLTENTSTFGAVMNDFFMNAVTSYADNWEKQFGRMAGDAVAWSNTTMAAMGGTPIAQYAGAGSKNAMVKGAAAMQGAGNNYSNCIFVGNDLLATDPDVATLIMKLTNQQTIKAGGLPTKGPNK